jgi:hypothetical protein
LFEDLDDVDQTYRPAEGGPCATVKSPYLSRHSSENEKFVVFVQCCGWKKAYSLAVSATLEPGVDAGGIWCSGGGIRPGSNDEFQTSSEGERHMSRFETWASFERA